MKPKMTFFAGEENKKKVLDDLSRGQDAFERLGRILQKKLREKVAAADYDNPSWAYKQADRNGYNRAIREVLELITTEDSPSNE